MRIRHDPATAAAILLVGVAALHGLLGSRLGPAPAAVAPAARQALPAAGTQARTALEWCRENVAIIHDVHWASACSAAAAAGEAEDSTECTLPDERARPLNVARASAEQQCLDDALAGTGAAPAR
ncbi:hypothetical protein H8N03_06670 [Ramlibacter sp. USB13]|uniref:Uncharacterized protein n=1 Tax=Ramlibacter cellulosilyticus TaxID=2764187 RepID=A0A923SE62_9BURK|nr:hypothetical protein [Ramlibacter cellulosilyticus]MBC5782622.1 hypothetical protein [Ramlibacter cellulosilyticus]